MFIPLHDSNPLNHVRFQFMTVAIIAVNVVAYFLTADGLFETVRQADVLSFGVIPAVITDAVNLPVEYVVLPEEITLVSYAFMHGDIWHLGGNMLFLWVFGDNVEDAVGHFRFLIFYLLCAIGGALVHIAVMPESQSPLIGASGATAGIVAAYLLLHPHVRLWVLAFGRFPIPISALWALSAWIIMQFIAIATSDAEDAVAWWAHVGGIVTGAVLILIMRRRGVPLFDRETAA
ncbi:MAG: rhomboid family intramembrane serine protease [Hyphomicrobiales bacterium]|nr:rhomboid family intramembrane serine protease [Hyphomicrobiales bacterium]